MIACVVVVRTSHKAYRLLVGHRVVFEFTLHANYADQSNAGCGLLFNVNG